MILEIELPNVNIQFTQWTQHIHQVLHPTIIPLLQNINIFDNLQMGKRKE
jgi:hypothetical protein